MPPRARSDDPWRRAGSARARRHHRCDGDARARPITPSRRERRTLVPAEITPLPRHRRARPKSLVFLPAQRLRRPDQFPQRQRPRRPRDRGAAIAKEGRDFTKGRRRDARERLLARARFVFRGKKRTGRGQGPRQGLCRRTTTKRVGGCRVYGGVGCLFKWRCGFQSTTRSPRPARHTTTKSRVHRRLVTHDARRAAGHELAHGVEPAKGATGGPVGAPTSGTT